MQNEERLRGFLREKFPGYDDSFGASDDLSQVVDSLGLFDLLEFVEREFGVEVPTAEFSPQRFSSIDGILAFVEELQSQ